MDSWTPGPKPLCHRHPTGPHPSGLLWTPWTPAKGDSMKNNFALARPLTTRPPSSHYACNRLSGAEGGARHA